MTDLALAVGDYRLGLLPARGGAIARFDWRGAALMRPVSGPSVLDTACFPLVPWSNRIAFGHMTADRRDVRLPPNHPRADHPHPLHGIGWLAPWAVAAATGSHAVLRHRHAAGAWPWAYEAEQTFDLTEHGLDHRLSVRNLASSPMPAGLGVHPYFPRTDATIYRGLHRAEWDTAADGLPRSVHAAREPTDWWAGAPVATRIVDTVYGGREGPLTIDWPERRLRLTIAPSADLSFTVVYVPDGASFFCVEPVSHPTNAINLPGTPGLRWLAPGEAMTVSIGYRAAALA